MLITTTVKAAMESRMMILPPLLTRRPNLATWNPWTKLISPSVIARTLQLRQARAHKIAPALRQVLQHHRTWSSQKSRIFINIKNNQLVKYQTSDPLGCLLRVNYERRIRVCRNCPLCRRSCCSTSSRCRRLGRN